MTIETTSGELNNHFQSVAKYSREIGFVRGLSAAIDVAKARGDNATASAICDLMSKGTFDLANMTSNERREHLSKQGAKP